MTMKKIITLIITVIILPSVGDILGIGLFAQSYSGGNGMIADPYHIANKADLKYLSETPTDWNKHFIQTANIYFTAADFAIGGNFHNGGEGFIPIGNNSIQFIGTYNGQEHVIDSLIINRVSSDNIGFFGHVTGYINPIGIKNLGITNIQVNGYVSVGSLVGGMANSTIINSYATGSVNGHQQVGGLVGAVVFNSTINNSHSSGSVDGYEHVGGLVGGNQGSTINNSYSSGTISGSGWVGGLVGYNTYGNISNSYATGNVIGSNFNVGGLVGANDNSTINDSYSTGNVSANGQAGGLVGVNSVSCTISTSYATGSVNGTGNYVGGLVGNNASIINNCYATGNVTGNTYIGGFAGYNSSTISTSYSIGNVNGSTSVGGFVGFNNSAVNNSFWDNQTSGQTASAGGTGLPTSQMQTQNNFTTATWDFEGETTNGINDYWSMPCLGGYPLFSWQTDPATTFSSITTTALCSYTWSQNGITYASTGAYNDTITNAVGCDSIITLYLTINTIDVSITNTSPTLTANTTGANYQWLDCNNNFAVIVGETNQSYTATTNGNYAVEITQNGCTDTSDCEAITNVGIINNSFNNNLVAFPNPTNGKLYIELGNVFSNVNVIVRNTLGQEVINNNYNSTNKLDLTIDGQPDIYFIEIITNDKKTVLNVMKE